MPQFAKDLYAADPDTYALVDMHRTRNWAEVDEELNRVASLVLAADLGVKRRLAVFAENASETALAHLGGLIAGASTVPVNFHLTADEAAYILQDSEAKLLFVDAATAERGIEAAAVAGIDTVVGWRCDLDGVTDWETWLATGSPDDPPMDSTPLPHMLYTSGTTGRPKGVELPPTMFAGGDTIAEHIVNLGERDRRAKFASHLVVGPMYHTGPLSGTRLLCAGLRSVILGRFDAEATIAAIDKYKTETTVMVPTHFVRMLALPDEVKAKYDVSSMKAVGHTGAKCPVDVKEAMIHWWGPVFSDSYGSTEVGVLCRIGSEEWLTHKGSVGRAIEPFSSVVLDDEMNELPANTEGNLFFRDSTGRGIIYPNDPEKTAASNPEPGLFTIGEVGYVDDDGYVFITDRASDMVVSGGANLYPAEAEQLLIDHPQVADVGCIGVPHPDMGEELQALVIAEDPGNPPDVAELAGWLRERLTAMKCPRKYHVVTDLRRNTMGKINKRKLRDAWLAGDISTLEDSTA